MPKKIIVYSTPSCPYCHQVKDYLKEKGVNFVDKNVATDEAAAEAMTEKTGQMGVPVIEIDGEIVIGFDKAAIDNLLS